MRPRQRHAVAREPERRLDQPRPRQASVRAPERIQPGRQSRHAAGCRPDRVVDELGSERDFEPEQLRLPRLGTEPRARRRSSRGSARAARGIEVDRMSAAEEPGHHGLGDARGERGGDGRVGGAAAGLEDLDPTAVVAGCPAATAGGLAHCDSWAEFPWSARAPTRQGLATVCCKVSFKSFAVRVWVSRISLPLREPESRPPASFLARRAGPGDIEGGSS